MSKSGLVLFALKEWELLEIETSKNINKRGINMFFLKKNLEDGSVIETQLNESDEYYCYCPKCGKKVKC